MIEMKDLLAEVEILQQCRTALAGAECVLIVADDHTLLRRQPNIIPLRLLMRLATVPWLICTIFGHSAASCRCTPNRSDIGALPGAKVNKRGGIADVRSTQVDLAPQTADRAGTSTAPGLRSSATYRPRPSSNPTATPPVGLRNSYRARLSKSTSGSPTRDTSCPSATVTSLLSESNS
ncbi:hypothetical protein NWFMUON74_43690 [Nocardia wallacei]|uniref:Uncharacterized protein n=1 Tax=Nocardia wallacei TaxID=480035 RepID=A0A7G1KMZ1_9NOCA|nr:hypothetical protein NWFMUON74_43690 [Nocardia wallacei]